MTRQEIEQLYKHHACPHICPLALAEIPDHVLKRTIAKSIYRSKVIYEGWDRRRVMHIIVKQTGLTMRVLQKYFPAKPNGCSENLIEIT